MLFLLFPLFSPPNFYGCYQCKNWAGERPLGQEGGTLLVNLIKANFIFKSTHIKKVLGDKRKVSIKVFFKLFLFKNILHLGAKRQYMLAYFGLLFFKHWQQFKAYKIACVNIVKIGLVIFKR